MNDVAANNDHDGISAENTSSNVAIYNPVTKKADRVGSKLLDDGRRVRFYKSNGEVIDA